MSNQKSETVESPEAKPGCAARSGSASLAVQEIQLGVLLTILAEMSANGFLKLVCAVMGAAYMILGSMRSIRE